jgi:hypothetical protein
MRPAGSYKIASRDRAFHDCLEPWLKSEHRLRRIVESLRNEIATGGAHQHLRIRQVFANPREIYRVELEVPELNYQRTTLLDREALENLLQADEVRAIVNRPS